MTATKPLDTVGGSDNLGWGFFREYLITSLAFLRKEGLVPNAMDEVLLVFLTNSCVFSISKMSSIKMTYSLIFFIYSLASFHLVLITNQ